MRARPRHHLGLHWNRSGDDESGVDDRRQHRLPTRRDRIVITVVVRLLVCVIDRDRKFGRCRVVNVFERDEHVALEENPRGIPSALSSRRRDQFRLLRRAHLQHQLRVNAFERASHPHIKKIREIGISDVVVVRRIGRYHYIGDREVGSGVVLSSVAVV